MSEAGRVIRSLRVGESILFETEKALAVARKTIHKLGGKCCSRKIPGAGWRLWRVE